MFGFRELLLLLAFTVTFISPAFSQFSIATLDTVPGSSSSIAFDNIDAWVCWDYFNSGQFDSDQDMATSGSWLFQVGECGDIANATYKSTAYRVDGSNTVTFPNHTSASQVLADTEQSGSLYFSPTRGLSKALYCVNPLAGSPSHYIATGGINVNHLLSCDREATSAVYAQFKLARAFSTISTSAGSGMSVLAFSSDHSCRRMEFNCIT